MNLEPKMRQVVRLCFLRHLDVAAPTALTTDLLAAFVRGDGFPISREAASAELAYLRDKGFLANPVKAISPEIVTWQITAAGRDEYARISNPE